MVNNKRDVAKIFIKYNLIIIYFDTRKALIKQREELFEWKFRSMVAYMCTDIFEQNKNGKKPLNAIICLYDMKK